MLAHGEDLSKRMTDEVKGKNLLKMFQLGHRKNIMKKNSSEKSFDDKIENLKRNYDTIVGKTNSVEEG